MDNNVAPNTIELLQELADESYQERVWCRINYKGPEMSFFGEVYERFFRMEALIVPGALCAPSIVAAADIINAISSKMKAFDFYDLTELEIVRSRTMFEVRSLAATALALVAPGVPPRLEPKL